MGIGDPLEQLQPKQITAAVKLVLKIYRLIQLSQRQRVLIKCYACIFFKRLKSISITENLPSSSIPYISTCWGVPPFKNIAGGYINPRYLFSIDWAGREVARINLPNNRNGFRHELLSACYQVQRWNVLTGVDNLSTCHPG